MSTVVVSGMGAVSALGFGLTQNREGLIKGKPALSHLKNFKSAYSHNRYYGEIKLSDKQLADYLSINPKGVSRTSMIALIAIREALSDSGLTSEDIESSKTALIVGTTVGGLSHTDEFYSDSTSISNPTDFVSSYSCGSVTIFLQKELGVTGVTNTINSACSSGANAIAYGAQLIRHGLAERAIVGGTDSLSKFTINGFNALHILSPELCRPFDENRRGLNLGEGAGFLILEREENLGNKKSYGVVKGWGNSNDSFHASSISPNGDGPFLAMKKALSKSGLATRDIHYINTHGTATENNDLTESKAMKRLFKEVPTFQSTKSVVGHTLGAAGGLEAVYSLLALQHQECYPSCQFSKAIEETSLIPNLTYKELAQENVMSNSFGFGGNCTSLIFGK